MKKILFFLIAAVSIVMISINSCENSDNGNTSSNTKKNIPLESVEFNTQNINIVLGNTSALSVTKFPENATDKLTWTSDDPETVSVDQTGKITGLQLTGEDNEVEIIIKSDDNHEIFAKCYVTVISHTDVVHATGLTLTPSTLNLKMGETVTAQLIAEVQPANATDKTVNWTSSNSSVAAVSANGQVTALKDGNAVITASSNDGGFAKTCAVTVSPADQITIGSGVAIIESSGWLETLFVKWERMGAPRYNVYYRGNGISNWIKIDDPLIRNYGDYYRADIPGLKAGLYEVEVRAANASGVEFGDYGSVSNIQVEAHVRSGFAFANGKVPGAYNMDGTPKTGARIIYVTDTNKDTVSLGVKTSASKEETFTGLSAIILDGMQKGYENRPLIVRFIGKVNEKRGSPFTDSAGSVMIKDNGKNNNNTSYVTLEGIGDDATAYRWGIRSSRASNVEIRNLGFMLSNTNDKDAIELQDSSNMWIHNCDFFYGMPGGASDQKKGDGTLDIKECDFITISYNHFWDTGKSSLLGNSGSETPGRITYHHNWFDHSDSRHPLVRVHKVHMFNNFYDGVGKYGVIARLGGSIFVDRNYFQNTKKPILISQQGTDIATGSGVASDNGGMIKAYNNFFDSFSQAEYRPYNSSTRPIEFDAYEVTNPGDPVPSTIKAKLGGAAYDNSFLTYNYEADEPGIAKNKVTQYSGRYWRGDFTYTFAQGANTHTDEPMPDLDAKLKSYTGKLVSIQDSIGNSGGGDPVDPGNPGGEDPGQPPVEGSIICTFYLTKAGDSGSVQPRNTFFSLTSANGNSSMQNNTINGINCEVALKLESNTKINFSTTESMTLKLYTDAPNGNVGVNGTNRSLDSQGILTFELAAGSHQITRGSGGKNLWLIILEPM